MKTRILYGSILIVLLAALLGLDWWLEEAGHSPQIAPGGADPWPLLGLPTAVVMLLLIALALVEMFRLCAGAGVLLLTFSALSGAAILGTLPFWWQFLSPVPPPGGLVLLVLGVVVMVVFADQMARARTAGAIRAVACTLLTVLYLGVGTAIMMDLRVRNGVPTLVLFLAAVKSTDIGAYFVGSLIGRHKLIPWLSPGKTWEGLAGGLLAAAGVSMGLAALLPVSLSWPQAAIFGAVVGLFGQFADLCESLLKRSANLKDSGAVVPGFGGVLDILDSPLLAAPAAYMMLGILRS